MKSLPIYISSILIAACDVLQSEPPFQQQASFTAGANGFWNIDWMSETGRTYFIESSIDLIHWNYYPMIEFGSGIQSYGVNTNAASKHFIRLHYVYDTTVTTLQKARDADFDKDGIPNYYEVEVLGTDPLDKNSAGGDSDNNGLPEGWERYYFGGLGIADPNAILQADGLTNKEKADLGLNPIMNYSDTNASQPSSYSYDLVGRLTGVTAPVGAAGFTPDEEGNLTNAQ